jgi:hypothetical protein
MVISSIDKASKITAARLRILKKAPIFGAVHHKQNALANIKKIKSHMNSIKLSQLEVI